MGRIVVVAVVVLVSGCATHLDVRSVFGLLTFPEKAKELPKPNLELQAFSAAQLELLTAWHQPREVATCLRRFDGAWVVEAGRALEAAAASRNEALEVEVASSLVADCETLHTDDKALLALSLGRYVLGVRSIARSTTATTQSATALAEAGAKALADIATLLEATPVITDTSHPSLALSGGAANGAFTAGYLYELLLDRELALAALDASTRVKADQEARFGAIVGTSVGSLETQIVDLYFTTGPVPAPANEFFTRDAGYDPTYDPTQPPKVEDGGIYERYPAPRLEQLATGRDVQRRVLEILYRSFVTVDERTLICAENAPVTALVGLLAESRPNLMRFDPMTRNIIDPLLRAAGKQMNENDVLTTVVAVDTMQNQLIGLDERACSGRCRDEKKTQYVRTGTLEYCRSSGVMASVVLPFFARPVAHAYSGLSHEGGSGAWLDGGLRSTLPVYRALRASRPRKDRDDKRLRVLALTTMRAEGLPSPFPEDVTDVALNAIGQMSSQTIINEVVMAEQFSARRDRDWWRYQGKAVDSCSAPPPPSPSITTAANALRAPGLERSDAVHAVFVPIDAATGLVAEAGYAFDPFVMRGLFTWGRKAAVRDLQGKNPEANVEDKAGLGARLGWTLVAEGMADAAAQHEDEVSRLVEEYSEEKVSSSKPRRYERGRERIAELPLCGSVDELNLDRAPAFFFPDGGVK